MGKISVALSIAFSLIVATVISAFCANVVRDLPGASCGRAFLRPAFTDESPGPFGASGGQRHEPARHQRFAETGSGVHRP